MELVAIQFNHDPSSTKRSALNVRRNGSVFATVPEWQSGQAEISRAAYSAASTQGETIIIRARFTSPENAGRTLQIRARPTPAPGWVRGALFRSFWEYNAGALGGVRTTAVTFAPDGEAPFTDFELMSPQLAGRGVGVYNVNWTWEYRSSPLEVWRPITKTVHRIYGLLDVPTAPWVQQPYDSRNTQLPWTDVFDVACRWAAGTRSPELAAAAVTQNVYAFGAQLTSVSYACRTAGAPSYSFLAFDCTAFLDRLSGGHGRGGSVNCSDCATAVSTFSNALGCDLWQSQMFDGLHPFTVNPLQLIGQYTFGRVCGTGIFVFHEVAWTGDCGERDLVYDACLAGFIPGTLIPVVPAAMPFGRVGHRSYRQLLATPFGEHRCRPQPQTRDRRAVI